MVAQGSWGKYSVSSDVSNEMKIFDISRHMMSVSLLIFMGDLCVLCNGISAPKPSPAQYYTLVTVLIAYSLLMGRQAGLQPTGEWRLFSWHPFLMTCGMVGFAGLGAVTKKLGGYANTKTHGILGWLSLFCSFGGIYCIYRNKENNGYLHLSSPHAMVGTGVVISCVGLGLAGSIFLHPDFGMDKQNKTIRFAHKTASRLTLMLAWVTAFLGLFGIAAENTLLLAAYGLPLVALVPFVLM